MFLGKTPVYLFSRTEPVLPRDLLHYGFVLRQRKSLETVFLLTENDPTCLGLPTPTDYSPVKDHSLKVILLT